MLFLFAGKVEEWDTKEGDNLLCLVTAEGGWGKTALLAGLVHQAVKVAINPFLHQQSVHAASYSGTPLFTNTLKINNNKNSLR